MMTDYSGSFWAFPLSSEMRNISGKPDKRTKKVIDVDESGRCARKPRRLQHDADGVQYGD